jgi:hypothetical protein
LNLPLQPETKQNVEAKNNERLLVFEDTPAGEFFRPEEERRPEFGNTSPVSIFKFDGPLPETVNGRLAMLGMAAAFLTEATTGMSVYEQVSSNSTREYYHLTMVEGMFCLNL